jgi:hypothetical protein
VNGPATKAKLPHYLSSPEHIDFDLGEMGIRANFAEGNVSASFAANEISAVFGSFQVPREMLGICAGDPLAYASVSLTYQLTGEIRSLLVLAERGDSSGKDGNAVGDDVAALGGYFTIDLSQYIGKTIRFGKYWVVFQLGPYLSEVLELEVLDPRDCIVEYDLFTGLPIERKPPKPEAKPEEKAVPLLVDDDDDDDDDDDEGFDGDATMVDPELMLGDDDDDDTSEGFDPDSTVLDFTGGEKEIPKFNAPENGGDGDDDVKKPPTPRKTKKNKKRK